MSHLNIKNSLSKFYNSLVFLHRKISSNTLYDIDQVCIIAIGNLCMGGTGKTPMTISLAKQIQDKTGQQVAIISRGYKRKSKIAQEVSIHSRADEVGDEPLLIKRSTPDTIVWVSKNRNTGIRSILASYPNIGFILLDDGLQHWQIKPHISILLTTYQRPFFDDHVIPRGRLREDVSGASRADIIVVTKCPELTDSEKKSFEQKIKPKEYQSIFFSQIIYDKFQQTCLHKEQQSLIEKISAEDARSKKWCLVTGLADANHLVKYVKSLGIDLIHLSYNDHHHYTSKDIKTIISKAKDRYILSTEKDLVKWHDYHDLLMNKSVYAIPITLKNNSDSGKDMVECILQKKHSFK